MNIAGFVIMLLVLIFIGYLMLRYLEFGLKNNKWELVKENVKMRQEIINPIVGKISEGEVYVDVYRKQLRNGIYKYKNVNRQK